MTDSSGSYQSQTKHSIWQTALPHLIFLLIAALIMFLSVMMRSEGQSKVLMPWSNKPMPETCSAKLLIGISCPGCGLTRSFIAISNGQFEKAWSLNPASFLVYAFIGVQIPWQGFQLYRIRSGRREVQAVWIYVPVIICSSVLMVQWIVRLCMGITTV